MPCSVFLGSNSEISDLAWGRGLYFDAQSNSHLTVAAKTPSITFKYRPCSASRLDSISFKPLKIRTRLRRAQR
jgi:hypothetical protein